MMPDATIPQIEERLKELSPEQLTSVLDFVSYLAERQASVGSLDTMLATEAALSRDWLRPEEDEAWSDFVKGDVVVVPFTSPTCPRQSVARLWWSRRSADRTSFFARSPAGLSRMPMRWRW